VPSDDDGMTMMQRAAAQAERIATRPHIPPHNQEPASIDAALEMAKGGAASGARAIVRYMASVRDANCYEVQVALGMKAQTASARFNELKRDGVIVATGDFRQTDNPRYRGAVYRLATADELGV